MDPVVWDDAASPAVRRDVVRLMGADTWAWMRSDGGHVAALLDAATGKVVAACRIRKAWIRGLIVRSDSRGRGLCGRLLRGIFEHYRGDSLLLEVLEGNAPAIRCYEREGFVDTGVGVIREGKSYRRYRWDRP